MSRTLLEVLTRYVNMDPTSPAQANAATPGDGVEYPHSKSQPALLMIYNGDSGNAEFVIPTNNAIVKGIPVPSITFSVASGQSKFVWVPPDYYATAGKVGVDITAYDDDFTKIKFWAVRGDAQAYAHNEPL